MPITKSASKALRSSRHKRALNERRKRAMKEAIKIAKKSAANHSVASLKLQEAYQAIDKAAKRGVIKKNAAARKKSRLAKAIAQAEK
jgi:small subunit ribosomal protein S20